MAKEREFRKGDGEMPNSFDAVERLWKKADPADKEEYLFKALVCMREEFRAGIAEIRKHCCSQQGNCSNQFVTKKQAKIVGVILVCMALGVGIGAGYISASEVIKAVTKIGV